uniref:Uncharacterized protein n=1 Tax=Anguilla anguilla TaxID=7936 RepID=A0A0E9PLF6_ANGAN
MVLPSKVIQSRIFFMLYLLLNLLSMLLATCTRIKW